MAGSPKKRAKRAKSDKRARAEERIAALPREVSLALIPDPDEPRDRWGRPTKFKPEYVEIVRVLCEEGFTDRELADFLEIDRKTLYNWRGGHPELIEAMGIGKQIANSRVDRTVYELAIGYRTTITKHLKVRDQYGNEVIKEVTEEVEIPPNLEAAKWWQTNRDSENWKLKTEQRVTVQQEPPPREQLEREVRAMLEDLRRKQCGVDDPSQ